MSNGATSTFGSFRFDTVLREGERVIGLTPKAFAVLRILIDSSGQVVTRDELWRRVWPGATVTDAALNVCISEIRRALRDDARSPRFVATVPRRGYRFVCPISTPHQPSASAQCHQGDDL
jgi:DNA-binding winged helix-turn-helix (wHTH) protein